MKKETCPMSKESLIFDFKKGLETEYKAMELCEKLLPLLDHELDREEISGIIADEKEHIGITNRLIEITNKYYTVEQQ